MKSMEIKNIFRKKEKNTRVIPGFGLTMGITVTMLSLLILIPLISVFIYSFKMKPSEFWQLITAKQVANALATSFLCSFLAAIINSIFGVILAWVLVRYEFPGKRLVDGLIELPFALPTAVAGITLSKMYSSTGMLGKTLSMLGIDVSYTKTGIVVALVFVGIPFVVRAIQPVLEKLDGQYEEAAYIRGWQGKNLLPCYFTGTHTGTFNRIRSGTGKGNRRVRKCYLHIRKQCKKPYTGHFLCNYAEIKLYRL